MDSFVLKISLFFIISHAKSQVVLFCETEQLSAMTCCVSYNNPQLQTCSAVPLVSAENRFQFYAQLINCVINSTKSMLEFNPNLMEYFVQTKDNERPVGPLIRFTVASTNTCCSADPITHDPITGVPHCGNATTCPETGNVSVVTTTSTANDNTTFIETGNMSTVTTTSTANDNSTFIETTTTNNTTYPPTTESDMSTTVDPILAIMNLLETDTLNQTHFLTALDEFAEQFYSLPETYVTMNNLELIVIKRNANELRSNGTSLIQFSKSTVDAIDIIEDTNNLSIIAVLLQIKLQMNQTQEMTQASSNPSVSESLTPISSLVVIAVFQPETKTKLQARVSYTASANDNIEVPGSEYSIHEPTVRVKHLNYRCMFYDARSGMFSSFGCNVNYTDRSNVTCYCNHTTVFAVLLSTRKLTIPFKVKLISYVTESISLVFLLTTFLILLNVRKKIRSDRTIVQINLVVALFFLHLFTLLQGPSANNFRTCELSAVLVHYFLLASGMWMLLEGVTLAIKTTDKALLLTSNKASIMVRIKVACGWGIPGVIVGLSAVIAFPSDSYMEKVNSNVYSNEPSSALVYERCWLSTESGVLVWSVIAPLILIWIINVGIVIKVGYFVYQMSKKGDQFRPQASQNQSDYGSHVRSAFKALLLLFPVLGVPWIFGFLTGIEQYELAELFMYLNVIINGLQGFFMFIVYYLCGSEVRRATTLSIQRQFQSSFTTMSNAKRMRSSKVASIDSKSL